MKLNWGHKIFGVYTIFALGMLYMAYKANQQKFDLVQTDYYADELKYQNVIDASSRAAKSGGEVEVSVKGSDIAIQLPASFTNIATSSKVHLYYAADASKDVEESFESMQGNMVLRVNGILHGNYTLKLDVEKQGVKYYFEKKLFL
jgi:predicted HicB family RNase H-like nuclease